MALNKGKKIVWSSCDVIPIPDTGITSFNAVRSDQSEQLVFTNRHGRSIGNVEIPEVDPYDVDHIKIWQVDPSDVDNIDIPGVDVVIQEPQFINIVNPNIPPTDQESIEPSPVHQ